MAILITGGGGFAGSHLVELLLQDPSVDIHVLDRSTQEIIIDLLPADQIHQADLTDQVVTKNVFKRVKPDQIYHLAALASVGDSFSNPSRVLTINTQLQISVLESIKQVVPKARTLIIGSAQEYDPHQVANPSAITETDPLGPHNPYGLSKVDQDLLALSYHYSYQLDIVRVRPFNHIGPRQQLGFVVPDFAHQLIELEKKGGGVMKVGNLEAVRDFSGVTDIVTGYRLLMEQGIAGDVYNLASGRGTSIQELLHMMIELVEADITVEVDQSKLRPIDFPVLVGDISKAKKLGYQPTQDLKSTLEIVLRSMKN